MRIGVPKEIKDNENRVSVTPAGVMTFTSHGHEVIVQKGAGLGSGISDEEYKAAGAKLADTPEEVFARAEMIMKVKEPQPVEFQLFRQGQILFTYLHLAGEPEVAKALLDKRVIAIAYETVQRGDGSLPLLTPMSEIAGRMSVQIGAHHLERPHGGKGILLGGVTGVPPAEVVIIGAGVAGSNAAKIAEGMGAQVTVIDRNLDRLRYLDEIFHGRIHTVASNPFTIARAVRYADLLISSVLIPGARAPRLVTEEMVKSMRPGAVIVDVAIDQGGSVETVDRVTTHSNPTYVKHGVIHYSVANIPGAVPRTSTFALTNATLPYALELADKGLMPALAANEALAKGVNIFVGKVTHPAVAEALQKTYHPLDEVIERSD